MWHVRCFSPRAAVLALGISVMLWGLIGCGDTGPERAPIKGKITVGGRPLPSGQILFVPIAPTVGPSASAAIKNGEYAMKKDAGPIIGTHRVEVEADLPLGFAIDDDVAFAQRQGKPLPPNPIPKQFNRQSTLTFEIKAKIENDFSLDVPATR
jgi:hypothetical protein